MTTLIVLIIYLIIGFFMIRNCYTYIFRMEVEDKAFSILKNKLHKMEMIFNGDDFDFDKVMRDYNEFQSKIYTILDKWSYERMLFSFKRLKPKNWFTEEEIKLLEL